MPAFIAAAGRWDAAVLLPVREINEQLLQLLCATARTGAGHGGLVRALRAQWCALTPPLQARVASCPYVLLDAGFAQPQRWLSVHGAVMDGTPGLLTDSDGVALVRQLLSFAWHLAHSNALAARVVLGMSPACAAHIVRWRLADLELLAGCGAPWITPRWPDRLGFWRALLGAAAGGGAPLAAAQLRGLQLLAAATLGESAPRRL